ncbi:TetR/AcrR family transcriptional regulator [Calidifontibacter sp. DB0510]|uniref:TetR/AcrR family transcriptional regulator n=1 Tax=Metallococcus carri TaxID=1656884 RepID=A0A967B4N5_9MICO|nr:TetR/AcrR family transcriptional regulator [Metallococcus carri]NHN55557.1 TetR/AcrR family transcriptional regulator [Metallococcus carri]NOP38259.1 TetR/AcrR family transcriptional regulator [Calidifontibacter sp. DB2511S]
MAERGYHHGDLPATLVRTAMEMLAEDGGAELSLRAVARRAKVSPAAPYRHFPDRMALLSAIAAVGYRELLADLTARQPEPKTADDLADLAVAYVDFALARPGLFRVMFAEGCDRTSPDRVAAVAAIHAFLAAVVERAMRTDDPAAVATGMWALVHGLAFLHLDGKLDAEPAAARTARVRATVAAMLSARTR